MKPAVTQALMIASTLLIAALATPRASAQDAALEFREVHLPLRAFEAPVHAIAHTEAKILVGGYLPSTCYLDPRTTVESPDGHTHYVRTLARKIINRYCTQPMDVYEDQVSLGELDAGEHTLIVEAAHGGVMVERFTVSN